MTSRRVAIGAVAFICFCLPLRAQETAAELAEEGGELVEHVAPGGDEGEHDAAAHGHEEHIGEKGVDKRPEEFRSDLAIFTLIVFLLLFGGLRYFAWPKISAALDAREARIHKAVADAENARAEAQALVKEHQGRIEAIDEDVREIIAEARRDAEHTKADIIATANTEAETIRNRAIVEINRAKDQALNELFETMAAQVTLATEHVLGHGLNESDRNQLIEEALNQIESRN